MQGRRLLQGEKLSIINEILDPRGAYLLMSNKTFLMSWGDCDHNGSIFLVHSNSKRGKQVP